MAHLTETGEGEVKTRLKNSLYPLMYLLWKTVCPIWVICWLHLPARRQIKKGSSKNDTIQVTVSQR